MRQSEEKMEGGRNRESETANKRIQRVGIGMRQQKQRDGAKREEMGYRKVIQTEGEEKISKEVKI